MLFCDKWTQLGRTEAQLFYKNVYQIQVYVLTTDETLFNVAVVAAL
jgi:hypothetical protein